MEKIALSIPGFGNVDSDAPAPTGGLSTTGQNAIQVFIIFIVIIAIFFAFWSIGKGGFDIIQSKGKKETFQKGRERVLYAFFGLIMIFLSFFFINIISTFLGVDLFPFFKYK